MSHVSGIGYYTTTFNLPADWSGANGAYLDIESLCRNTAYVWVNDQRAVGLDFVAGFVDVSGLLKPGENTIKIEVASTLRNRMINLGYSGMNNTSAYLPPVGTEYTGPAAGGRYNMRMPVADYGMVGNVTLVTYTEASIQSSVLADIRSDEAEVVVNTPASYIVSLDNAKGAGIVTLSFTFDSSYLNIIDATPLNGLAILSPLSLEYVSGGVWKGTVKLICPNFVKNNDPLDILRINGKARDTLGETVVTLADFYVTGNVDGYSGTLPCSINTASATTSIVAKTPVYSKYDLNKDGKINELDLAIAVFYYLKNDLEADWEAVTFDIASAKDCDVARNGVVDLADLIEIIANYCDSYNLFP